jgi:NTP pyrophosphatase (non-canonical NTP hydrolase)
MDFSVYQSASSATAKYPAGRDGLYYLALGLTSEAGEVAGKVKKAIRDEDGFLSDERVGQICAEIGDVLWYCAQLAEFLGVDLNDVAKGNIEKLQKRLFAGTISGDGDYR